MCMYMYKIVSVCVCVPRAILSTLMILIMVGLMGRAALILISSRVMPMMDSSTMARSSWFHLHTHTRTHSVQQHYGQVQLVPPAHTHSVQLGRVCVVCVLRVFVFGECVSVF